MRWAYHEAAATENGIDVEDAAVDVLLSDLAVGCAFLVFLIDALGRDVPLAVRQEVAVHRRGGRDAHGTDADKDGKEPLEEKYVAPSVNGYAGSTPAWDLGQSGCE